MKLWLKEFFMAFLSEIRRNGVLYSGVWMGHHVLNRTELNWYIGKSKAINGIEKKGDINDIPQPYERQHVTWEKIHICILKNPPKYEYYLP